MKAPFQFPGLFIVLSVLLLKSTVSISANYYWVGGSGEINDYSSHWATTSGGATFHSAVPGATDNLIFDANSFTAPGQVVTENTLSMIEANDFICSGTLYNPTFNFSSAPLFIHNSFVLEPGITWGGSIGEIWFTGTSSSNIVVDTKGIPLFIIYSDFPSGGTLSLASDLNCTELDLTGATFRTNNFNVSSGKIIAYTSAFTDIYFGTSNIFCDGGSFDLTNAGTNVDADSCTVSISNAINFPFICTNQHYNKVIVNTGSVNGNNATINYLEYQGSASTGDMVMTSSQISKLVFSGIGGDFNCTDVYFDTLIFSNGTFSHITLNSTDTLFVNDLLIINPGTELDAAGGGPCVIKKLSGVVCTDGIQLWNIEATGGAQFFAGPNSIDNGGNTGWQFTACAPVSGNVWPGDANYDLIVNNLDLINVGTNFGTTGPVRAGGSNSYTAQPCNDWVGFFNNGVNFKHADCNGDGAVDADDTLAIVLNYGQSHPFRNQQPLNITSGGSDLYFDLTGINLTPGSTVTIPVKLGTLTNTVASLYGTAFTINYNPAYVDAQGVSVSFSNSWLSSGLMLSVVKDFPAQGKVDISLVRTDQTDVGGSGTIAEITFTIPLNATGSFFLTFEDVTAVISSNTELIVSPVDVGSPTQTFNLPADAGITFFPNPVITSLHINALNEKFDRILIRDLTGRIVKSMPQAFDVDFSSIQKGIYFVELLNDNKLLARVKISRM